MIVLLLSLLIPIVSYSQDTYPIIKDSLVIITPQQLKITNLIFNEHAALKEKVPLLNLQIEALEKANRNYAVQDSIRTEEINLYENSYKDAYKRNKKLNKKVKRYRYWSIAGGIVSFLLGVLVCQ